MKGNISLNIPRVTFRQNKGIWRIPHENASKICLVTECETFYSKENIANTQLSGPRSLASNLVSNPIQILKACDTIIE